MSAGFKAQPVYKAKGPLPGRKQRNGFLGNRTVPVFASKGIRKEGPLNPSPVLYSVVHLE